LVDAFPLDPPQPPFKRGEKKKPPFVATIFIFDIIRNMKNNTRDRIVFISYW